MENAVLVVAAAIVDDLETPGALLAARRSRPAHLVGRWEFPGGKVDAGEEPEAALHREIGEELGVRVELGAEIVGPDAGGWIITDRHVMRLWFARIVDDDEPVPLVEHDELRWLPGDSLTDVDWLDGDVRIVEHVRPFLLDAPTMTGQAGSSSPEPSAGAGCTCSPASTR